MKGGNIVRLTRLDALSYLAAVKETLYENTSTYKDFLNLLKDYKARRIDVAVVRKRVKELFKYHKTLIFCFNAFLPRGYEILAPKKQDPTPIINRYGVDEAVKYFTKIKRRFEGNDHVYGSFVRVVDGYGNGRASICHMLDQVLLLFKGHSDLIEESFRLISELRRGLDNGYHFFQHDIFL